MLTDRRSCRTLLGVLLLLICIEAAFVRSATRLQRRPSGRGGGPAATAVAAAAGGRGGAGFPLSSYNCSSEPNKKARICFLENVFLYKGQVWFVAANASAVVPRMRATYWRFGADQLDWLQPTVVTPATLPAGVEAAEVLDLTGPRHEVHLWSTLSVLNYGHYLGEFFPSLHATLCRHLGRCTAGNVSGLHIFELFHPPQELLMQQAQQQAQQAQQQQAGGNAAAPPRLQWPAWMDDATACFAERPKTYIGDPAIMSKVVRIRKAMVGVGAECRAHLFCNGDELGLQPISAELVRSYRARMAACLGFSAEAVASLGSAVRLPPSPPKRPVLPEAPQPAKLRMLLVDRRYSSGRSILNIGEVQDALRLRFGGVADVQLQNMEGLSLREQAALWNTASIVIHMHGASLGNYFFLPRDAVAVQIVSRPGNASTGNDQTEYTEQLERDVRPATGLTAVSCQVPDMSFTRLRAEAVWAQPEWQGLTAEQKVRIMERGECGHLADPGLVQHCLRHWLTMGLDVVLPIPQLIQAVDQAVEQLFAKQGAPLPARDATGAFMARDTGGSSSSSSSSSEDSSSGGGNGSSSKPVDCTVQPRSAGGQAVWLVPPLALLLLLVVAVLRRPTRPHRL